MANRLDSVCCSSSNPVDNNEDDRNFAGEFPIDHWNEETEESDDETGDINIEVFNEDIDTVSFMENTVCLEFPKFSKGFQPSDFKDFVRKFVGEENLESLKNGKYPNLWIMQVKTKEVRENLLRIWKTKIKNKTCWIIPYHEYELRGFLHWLPHFISDDDVKTQLSQFGDVLILENVVHDLWNGKVQSEVKYFGLRLKDGMVKNDMPHFLKFDGYRTLVMVRGRPPACFHCREFGHSKKDCKTYKEKMDEYCKNLVARKPRIKPRGRRHRSEIEISDSKENHHEAETKLTLTNIMPAQNCSEYIQSRLKQAYTNGILMNNKSKTEILAILKSLKAWKEKTLGMVEQSMVNMEQNLMTSFNLTEVTADEETKECIKITIDNMKQTVIKMIEKSLLNLKNIVAEHFGFDSNTPLERLISNFETGGKEKSEIEEAKWFEKELSYTCLAT